MNIVQLEDDIKSLPDDRLMTEMQAPTGGFPQYLVLSEIKRRKKMRDDYRGRMAAHEKTPPRPTIAEETVQEGISSIMPSNMPQGAPPQGMPMAQGMPVNRPASIEGGGLESLMPQGQGMPMGMAGGGRLPSFGILGALEGGIESDTSMGGMLPALYEYYMKKKEEEEEEEGMAGGGRTNRVMLGKTNYQDATDIFGIEDVSYDTPYGQSLGIFTDYFTDQFGPSDAEEEYRKAINEYYAKYLQDEPERLKKEAKFGKGMNLIKAGLAVSTARTPEQFAGGMEKVIEGATEAKKARTTSQKEFERSQLAKAKLESDLARGERKEKLEISKLSREAADDLRESGMKSKYYDAMIAQMSKDPDIIKIAQELAASDPTTFGIVDAENKLLRPNTKAIIEAGKITKAYAPQEATARTIKEEARIQAEKQIQLETFSLAERARKEAEESGGDFDTIYEDLMNKRIAELIDLWEQGAGFYKGGGRIPSKIKDITGG